MLALLQYMRVYLNVSYLRILAPKPRYTALMRTFDRGVIVTMMRQCILSWSNHDFTFFWLLSYQDIRLRRNFAKIKHDEISASEVTGIVERSRPKHFQFLLLPYEYGQILDVNLNQYKKDLRICIYLSLGIVIWNCIRRRNIEFFGNKLNSFDCISHQILRTREIFNCIIDDIFE